MNTEQTKRCNELRKQAADNWVAANWFDILDHVKDEMQEYLTDEEYTEYETLFEMKAK